MQSSNGLYVYYFHYDDDQQGWVPVEAFSYPRCGDITEGEERPSPAFIEKVKATLKECGWEGDGTLGAMMVPPFFSCEGDSYWFPIFHVKQENNGTSWIASGLPLSVSLIPASK
jgi:hypothetical protein